MNDRTNTAGAGTSRPGFTQAQMGDKEFKRFSELIQSEFGIKMPPSKKTLLQARFQKRLRSLGLASYAEYCEYVFSPEGMERERPHLIDVVTTNTTHFFREPRHFEILQETVLPELTRSAGHKRLRVWSAGCSSGEEPYTLAMVLEEYRGMRHGMDYSILATDISMEILGNAARGVYTMERAKDVPRHLLVKYMLRSKDRANPRVKVVKELRNKITFRQLNFMEPFRMDQPMDVIFCRNVVIYFDRPTQEVLFQKFCNSLAPGGYLFIGHSESLSGMRLPVTQVAPTVFRRH